MLHISKIYAIIERSTREKGRIPFNCTYITGKGKLEEYKGIICLSSHFRPATINIQTKEGEVRKLRTSGIISINGTEIFM